MSVKEVHRQKRGSRLALVMIALTAVACIVALLFRTPIRSRYWAARIVRSQDPAERAVYLTALCNTGDSGWWGTGVLLSSAEAEIRQYGMVVLHNVCSTWSQAALFAGLDDEDQGVRELAALGLAIHGDDAVVPTLREMYVRGDDGAATSACVALERLGTPTAVDALVELACEPASVVRRAALVDALGGIGEPACVPGLVELLADERACDVPPRADQLSQAVVAQLLVAGELGEVTSEPSTRPGRPGHPGRTIAERAAAALERIKSAEGP
ncbi:MAG: HEAT repeat domain-containing protein [Planctomycetota bacterium]